MVVVDELRGREDTAKHSQVAEKFLVVDNRRIIMNKKNWP